jgi:RNA polymerase sporulation-specific sigma factor
MSKYGEYSDEELLELLRDGETAAAEYLMEKYKPLVRKKARALYLAGGDQEDLLQEGMLGLYKAVREYRPDREASFQTFAGVCISRQMYSAVASARRKKHGPLNDSVSLNELEENQEYSLGTAENPETILLDQEAAENLRKQIETSLSPLEKKVLDLYLSGLDYLQIAARLARPAKSIDNALQRIRAKVNKTRGNC